MRTFTDKLYYSDSHQKSFYGTVLKCIQEKDHFFVILNKTLFFPEGGGQPADTGFLNGIPVLDVQEDGTEIYHLLSSPLTIGSQVFGEINWETRFSLMQHHSGEHIVSGLVHTHFGYDNVGFHMGNDAVTMDFNGVLTEENLRTLEFLANEAIYKDLPFLQCFPNKEDLLSIDYRSKKELEGQVRIIAIPQTLETSPSLSSNEHYYDICACCAPHMHSTGEIGIIKLISAMNYKGGMRVSMLCGFRALEDYNKKERAIIHISKLLSSKLYETPEAVKRLQEESAAYKGQLMYMQNQLFSYKAKEIPIGTEHLCLFEKELDGNGLRHYCNCLLERCEGLCALFSKDNHGGYKYSIASKKYDVRPFGKSINQKFNGKGGGTAEMVQGSIKDGTEKEIEKEIHALYNKIE